MSEEPTAPPIKFLCLSVMGFSDGGPAEVRILREGTQEECERVADNIPDVVYSGARPNPQALVVVMSESEFHRQQAEGTH